MKFMIIHVLMQLTKLNAVTWKKGLNKKKNEENQGRILRKLEGKQANSLVFFPFIMSCSAHFFSQETVMMRT